MLIRYGIYREKVAPRARLNTRRADLPVQYQLNLCSRESLCRSVICALPGPVSELDTTASMYCAGLGLELLGSFTDHEGFSGIMLGAPEAGWHLEFTHCRHHPVTPLAGAMKICWCCTIRSRRHGRHSAQPWTPPDFCALRRLTLTGRSMASLSSTGTVTARYCKTAPRGMVCDSSGMAAS